MPGLWSNLDFSTAKKPVSLGAVRRYIKGGNGSTTRVTLDKFGFNTERIPRYVATRCKGLKDLRIPEGFIGASVLEAVSCASNLKTLVIREACQISYDVVTQLLNHCPSLEHAEFQSVGARASNSRAVRWEMDMPNLRTLILDTPKVARRRGIPMLDVGTLLTKIPNIHTLSIQGWDAPPVIVPFLPGQRVDFSNLHQLQNLNISNLKAILPPLLPSNIRTIAMADCTRYPVYQGVAFADFDLPQLVSLSLVGWHELSLGELRACLIPSKGKVTHLDIGSCIALSSDNLKELIIQGYLEGIEDLGLKSCNINDEIAILLARNLPRLKNLDLAYTKISGVGVKALVTGLEGKMDHLGLDSCPNISVDAVVLARSMGVKVAFGFPDPLSKGRRIIHR